MSLNVFDRGGGRFELFSDQRAVGWVNNGTVAFRGFESRAAARRAATVAYDALREWVVRQRRGETTARNGRALGIRREGTVEWLTLADVAVGRLVSFGGADDTQGEGEFGFELILFPRISTPLHAAMAVDHALAKHGAVRVGEHLAVATS